jgi:hypothetical protein
MNFWREKEKKTVLAGLRLKKQQCLGRLGTVRGEPPRGVTTVPEQAIVALYYFGFFGK